MIKATPSKSFTAFFKLPSAGQLILHEDMMNDRLAKNLEYYMFFILSSLKKNYNCFDTKFRSSI